MSDKSMEGLVLKSMGKNYVIQDNNGISYDAVLKGKWRTKGLRTTNPLAVGDHVLFTKEDVGISVIEELIPRKNHIIRKSINLSKESHIVASNVDQALLIVTADQPPTSFGFIDRFLVAAESYHVTTIIVINKIDLPNTEERIADLMMTYEMIGYQVIITSAINEKNTNEIKKLLKGKVTVLAGHSGVGKSTLINKIEQGLDLKTDEVSDFHQKGKHTTTFAEMHPLSFGGYIIDTPGIKGYGIVGLEKNELALYFPEMAERLPECKFYNCTHIKEPKCAVKLALEEGEIPESRYRSYVNMFEEDENKSYR
jgi:ribosome biogenesis GTPase